MAFGDYLWSESLPGGVDVLRCPKVAIDSFVNIHSRKLRVISTPIYRLWIRKTAD